MSEQDVWEMHLKAALLLIREFRINAIVQRLDPRAVRVALKYALLVDDCVSVEHGFKKEEDDQLTVLAQKLFNKTLQEDQARKEGRLNGSDG